MLKWKQVEPMVLAVLSDKEPVSSTSSTTREYEESDIITWWNNAQMRLATAKPQPLHQEYRADDGLEIALPKLFYKPRTVMTDIAGQLERLAIEQLFSGHIGYCVYGEKLILGGFETPPARWLFTYYGHYPDIVDEDSIVHPPRWTHEALANYVGMQAMALEAIEDARYRKFATPVDAPGNPTHNPFLTVAEYYQKRFYDIINSHTDDDKDYPG